MNKPKIRFKGFSEEWSEVTLGEVGIFKSNGVDKKIYPGESMVNLLNYMDVYNSKHITSENCSNLMQVSASEKQKKDCDVKANDVFFTPTSETADDIGHVLVIEEDLPNTCYSYHLMRYRPNDNVFYSTFPNYAFQVEFVRRQLKLQAKGVQRFVISKPDFESLKVYSPSLIEQTKIAEYFGALDSLINLTEKKISSLKQVKQASLQSMFPQEGETTPRVRFKGFEGEWTEVTLGEVFDYERPDNYIVSSDKYSDDFTTPVLTANKGFILGYTNEKRTYDKPCIIFDDFTLDSKFVDFPFMVKSSALKILSIKDKNKHNLYFAFNRLNSAKIESLGHARHYISVVQPTKILTPSLPEQQAIGDYFSNLDKQIRLQEARLEKLKSVKASCLDLMFV